MTDNYAILVRQNLDRLFTGSPGGLGARIGARERGGVWEFRAFGSDCELSSKGILLDRRTQTGVLGILISLYALHAVDEPAQPAPFQSFKELPNSMPYAGAFAAHTEQILVPRVDAVESAQTAISEAFNADPVPQTLGGDFGFVLWPLPRIALCYIFYRADEEFAAAATCLFSSNAHRFLPTDALADVGEYTSRELLARAAAD